jgi:hypothetical protein
VLYIYFQHRLQGIEAFSVLVHRNVMKGVPLEAVLLPENLFVATYNPLRVLLKEVSGSLVKLQEAFDRVGAVVFCA